MLRPENKELKRHSLASVGGFNSSNAALSPAKRIDNVKDTNVNKRKLSFTKCVSIDEGSICLNRKLSPCMKHSMFSSLDEVSCDTLKDYSGVKSYESIDIYGVRIVPGVVSFENTFENQRYVEKVSVQNISKNCVTIRIYNPRAWSFRILAFEQGYQLAPGLKITRRIHYTCSKTGIVRSSLPIYINEKCYELPLEAYKGHAFVEIVPTSVDFGRVDIGGKAVERKVEIRNVSSCATKFLVDMGRNDLNLQVTPVKGWIRPHSVVTLRLQMAAMEAGELSSEIWITTDLAQSRVHVTVQACKRNLLVFHPNTTTDFTLIEFPITFFGCRRYQTVVIYNMAAASSAFVVLADFGNNKLEPLKQAKLGNNKSMQMFDVEPLEGRIRPFEGRIFTVWFQPQPPVQPQFGWKSKCVEEVHDFLCAVRIKRINVDDYGSDAFQTTNGNIDVSQNRKTSSALNVDILMMDETPFKCSVTPRVTILDDISVLLCLYGEAEFPSLTVLPDTLYFGELHVGGKEIKVIHVTNNSRDKLSYRYQKMPFFDVSPNFKSIEPSKTIDVEVTYNCRNIGSLKRKLTFDVLARSNGGTELSIVSHFAVFIAGEVKADTLHPAPKFNAGITPKITHEVGFLTDDVTFSAGIKMPKCAMAAVKSEGRPWLHTDAKIAFPNDRPLTIRCRPIDYESKTIFKGFESYIPPIDTNMTYTVEEWIKKKANDNKFLLYIRGTAAQSVTKDPCCKPRYGRVEPDPPILVTEKFNPNIPREVFVPLTFIQLYRIRVHPPFITFGNVTTSKNCSQWLTIENNNNFNVSAKMVTVSPGLSVQVLDHFIIRANSDTKILTTFNRENLGKYSGIITCVINGHHSVDIAVFAEVVPKNLVVNPDRVDYRLPEVPFAPSFVAIEVSNPLNTPVSFSWHIPEGSPFKIEPQFGMAYKRGLLRCAAYFEPESPNYKLHPLKLLVEGQVCNKLKCGITLPKPNVYFLEPILNVGCISSNFSMVKIFVIFNPDFWDAMFVVLNKEPMKGVTVEPHTGTIKAKSCFNLSLNIQITSEGPFEFVVYINIQNSVNIEMKVTGIIDHPNVEVTPKYINLNRIHCHSVFRTTLLLENKSKSKVNISFDMKDYPQFKASVSKKLHDTFIADIGFGLEPETSKKVYLHFIPNDLASYEFYLPVIINGKINTFNNMSKDHESHSKTIKNIFKKSSQVSSKRITSVPKQKETIAHLVLIDVAVLKPLLAFTPLELIFSAEKMSQTFGTINVSDEQLNICFRWEESQNIFKFQSEKMFISREKFALFYAIMPHEEILLTATLMQSIPGSYTSDVVVLVFKDDVWNIYNCFRLSATVKKPFTINPSTDSVYFPPVPLGVDISVTINLNVEFSESKYTQLSVDYEIKGLNAVLFKLEFPKGNLISGSSYTILPVKITFSSLHPISVKQLIEFSISAVEKCGIYMIATADNCVLTTHAFLKSRSGSNITLLEHDDGIEKGDPDSLPSSVADCTPPRRMQNTFQNASLKKSYSIMTMSSLKTYLSGSLPGTKSNLVSSAQGSSQGSDSTTGALALGGSDVDLRLPQDSIDGRTLASHAQGNTEVELIHQNEEYCFPTFPMEHVTSELAVHMRQTRNAVQQWIYEQVFNCSYYPILGSHSFSTFVQTKKDYGRATPVALRNVFDVLERICGRSVRRYFTSLDKLPEESNAKVFFIYNVYKQLIDFMVTQGALLSHVEPKYLMAYTDYCTFCKVAPITAETNNDSNQFERDNQDIMNQSKFNSISIHNWTDILLQMFKTLVLIPTVNSKLGPSDLETPKKIVPQDTESKKCIYSRAEEALMSWLTHHFNNQRSLVWPAKTPPERSIVNHDTDLEDGLVLAAVTAAYCPYLINTHFHQMFTHPKTISQAYHNTVCLLSAWNRIRLGFSVTPRDFSNPNAVNMLMLVVHLYRSLPTYKPESTIKFMATLNSSETQVVSLENTEDATITYNIEILQSSTSFTIEDCAETFLLKRKQTGRISVRYTARNTTKAVAILLLCGACMPPSFGRNYVFRLEGYAVKLPVSAVFHIVSPLNAAVTTSIAVESPHVAEGRTASYDIWIGDTEPQPGNLNALCWAKEKKRKIPRRLFILSDKLVVEQVKRQRTGHLDLHVCCFSQAVHHYWLLFMSEDIGDFIVKVVVSPGPPEPSSTLQVTLDPAVHCSCNSQPDKLLNCNRTVNIHVPCRNLDQWAAVRAMFELTISPSEQEFWAAYIESHIGFRLLQWMLEEKKEKLNDEIMLLFKKTKNYKVSCKSPQVFCESMIHVPNVRSKGTVPIKAHFAEDTPNLTTVLTLTSSDGEEIRCYNLNVICNF